MKKVLLITSPRDPRWLEAGGQVATGLLEFAKNVTEQGIPLMVTTMDRLEFLISKEGVKIYDTFNGCDIAEFDLIHLRNIDKDLNVLDYAQAITAYIRHYGGDILEDVDQGIALGKLSQMVLFRLKELPVPRTVASCDNQTLVRMALNHLSFPMIAKANNAMKGSDNHLVRTIEELEGVLLEDTSKQYVVQERIPNDGDYRVLFAGYDQEPLLFKRRLIEGSHLSNTSKGGEPLLQTKADLEGGYDFAFQAAKAVRRAFTGIDIMRNMKTGEWVLLEANINPALSMGAFLDQKVDLYTRMLKEKTGD